MRRNSKVVGVDAANGEQITSFVPTESPQAPPEVEDAMIVSPERYRAPRDMTLLADVVMRRRSAVEQDAIDRGYTTSPSHDCSASEDASAFTPVAIKLGGRDKVHMVASIEGAIECLTTLWPVAHGAAFEGALQACIDEIKGRASPMQVRLALVRAADVAGILVSA
ncbi:DUF982 domain-containing protein [Rhizobium sp. P38BS-XIX]|uniref:DUF982 domain-containing protein n=1 Tax=Rhizobium sp. P38BS-XIX TaxID=2726740 RepID=UPI001FED6FB8|nr:DUF982 domain-containing protein [Rhizobium sp. P38BS-XIX]